MPRRRPSPSHGNGMATERPPNRRERPRTGPAKGRNLRASRPCSRPFVSLYPIGATGFEPGTALTFDLDYRIPIAGSGGR